ncbi:MAG: MFS transporter [Acidobacteriia bacterium]|nr:MFS transporter [Terriglobia bacterium]
MFAVRALRHRNYRLFFGGQSVSLIGTWMTRIATSWLVYRLTGSALLLGVVGFAGQIPTFLLAPFAGVWVDRLDRHRVLVVTQILAMLQSFALAVLALTHRITIWNIVWLSAFQGLINAFDMPARQAFVVEMVEEREDLSNAIALNSSMVNMARLIGPSLAGVVIAVFGEGYCFLIDGFSYLAVIASLLLMRLRRQEPRRARTNMLAELKEGWAYVSGSVAIRAILVLLALVSLVGMPYTVLMPIFAGSILRGGPHTLGFLMAASGVGALTGAVHLASRRTVVGLGRVVTASAALFGIGLITFSQSRRMWLSLALMVVTGMGMMQQMAASNTILQTIVDEEKRGRVMSYFSMAIVGMTPFGSLLAGSVAARMGAPRTLLISGVCCVAGAAWFGLHLEDVRSEVRPIYRELGILPEIANGIHQASVLRTPPEE